MIQKYLYSIAFILLFTYHTAFSAQIEGGEIRAKSISTQSYDITVSLFLNESNSGPDQAIPKNIMVCLGNGETKIANRTSYLSIPGTTGKSTATYQLSYMYPVAGAYQISAKIKGRFQQAVNLVNSPDNELFLWTVINTNFENTTPELPVLEAKAGLKQKFTLNINPTDAEGDSVSFAIQKVSKSSLGTCGVRRLDYNYKYPNQVEEKGTFAIDQFGKKLIWTAPTKTGDYLFAFVMIEWRDGLKISETYREGIINVGILPGDEDAIPAYVYPETSSLISPDGQEAITMTIEAYPVPTDNIVNVKVASSKSSVITLQVIDTKGRIHNQFTTPNQEVTVEYQFDLTKYPKGLYIVRAIGNAKSVSKKIIR